MLPRLVDATVALLIGAAGGFVFKLIHMPLPWMLGALTASAAAALLGNRWPMPRVVRDFARPVVGVLAGASFTPEVARSLLSWWPALFMIVFTAALMAGLGYVFFRRICRFDPVTAYFAAVPGGLAEMSILGGSLGGSMRTLVLVHAVRIVTVVFAIPMIIQFVLGREIVRSAVGNGQLASGVLDWVIVILAGLAGYLVAKRWAFPGGMMVAAMLCSAIVHASGLTHAVPPSWLVGFVQVLIGCVAGSYFAGLKWSEFRSTVLFALVWSLVMLGIAAVLAIGAHAVSDFHFESLLLALAPAGTAEMIVISYAIGANVAFVAACQVARIFCVLAGAPLIQKASIKPIAGGKPPSDQRK